MCVSISQKDTKTHKIPIFDGVIVICNLNQKVFTEEQTDAAYGLI